MVDKQKELEEHNIFTLHFGDTKTATCREYRETAEASWNCSKMFYDKKVKEGSLNEQSLKVVYILIGYSLELYFKAFILWSDFSESTQNKLRAIKNGHNLEALYLIAKMNKFEILAPDEETLIKKLNSYYNQSEFRYCLGAPKKDIASLRIALPKPVYYYSLMRKIHNAEDRIIFSK